MNGLDHVPANSALTAEDSQPDGSPRPLAEVARDYKRGAASPQELFDAFVAARLWWPAPLQPGLPVVWMKREAVVPVFSSRAELALFLGLATPQITPLAKFRWLSTDGLRLLSLLPAGVMIGLDLGSDHRLSLNPAAVRLDYSLVLPKRGPKATGAGAGEGIATHAEGDSGGR